jgi:hypothetical protein
MKPTVEAIVNRARFKEAVARATRSRAYLRPGTQARLDVLAMQGGPQPSSSPATHAPPCPSVAVPHPAAVVERLGQLPRLPPKF